MTTTVHHDGARPTHPPGALTDEVAAEAVRRVRADLPALVDRIGTLLVTQIPFYGTEAAGTREEIWDLLTSNVEAALTSILGKPHDPAPATATGRQRARRGAPLADVLSAYRLGYSEIAAELVAVGAREPALPMAAMLELTQAAFTVHNLDAAALIHGHREESLQLMAQEARERAALVDVLLSEDVSTSTLLDVSVALRLPLEGLFVLVSAHSLSGQDPMPRVASALAALDVRSAWRLDFDRSAGVLVLPNASRMPLALDALRRHATGPVGVSPTFGSLREAAWAHRLAKLALAQAQNACSDRSVLQIENNAVNTLLAGGPGAALRAADDVLSGLDAVPGETSRALVHTLQVWVDEGGSAERAGAVLHCHANTVRQRLHRLESLTGRTLSRPADLVDLVVAVHAANFARGSAAGRTTSPASGPTS